MNINPQIVQHGHESNEILYVAYPFLLLFSFQANEVISAHKKGIGVPLSSSHKLQASPKKFEAPGK